MASDEDAQARAVPPAHGSRRAAPVASPRRRRGSAGRAIRGGPTGRRDAAARAAVDLDPAEPGPAAQAVRPGGAAGAGRLDRASAASCSRSWCGRRRRALRARRRRAPLARRAARRPREGPGDRARTATTPQRSRSRSSRTWPARTSTRSRRRAPSPPSSRSSGSRARRSAGGSAAAASAVSNLLRLLDLPDEALELLRGRRAQRGPRPRAAAGRATTPTAAASRARPPTEGWSVRVTEQRAREANEAGQGRDRGRRAARVHPDQEAAMRPGSPTRSRGARHARSRVRPRGTGYKVELVVRRRGRGGGARRPRGARRPGRRPGGPRARASMRRPPGD